MKSPIIQRKTVSALKPSDLLLMDAGVSVKAGKPADEKAAAFLLRHHCSTVPTMQFSGEQQQLEAELQRFQGPFHAIRTRLVERLKNIYTPYHESDPGFCARGKKKQLTEGLLFERDPGPLYQPDIDAGSEQQITASDIIALQQDVTEIFETLEHLKLRSPEHKPTKRTIPRLHLDSIRLGTLFRNDRAAFVGDALAWHSVDTALFFMTAIVNMNKERMERGIPYSESRFDPNSSTVITDEVRYRPDMIQSAALGILLHSIGFAHRDTQQLLTRLWEQHLEQGKAFDLGALRKPEQRILQKQYFAARNLLRNRDDIPPIARMMVSLQYDYPDLTGYPAPDEHRFLHEFVRMFHIIDSYDSLINPLLPLPSAQKQDAIQHIAQNSGSYSFHPEGYLPQHRYDFDMLIRWQHILAPYARFELLHVYRENIPNTPVFSAQVFSYNSHMPVLSIRKDKQHSYPFGALLLSPDNGMLMSVKNGEVATRRQAEWAHEVILREPGIDAADPAELGDPLYSSERNLSRSTHRL